MSPTKILFSFLFWKIVMIMSTTNDSSNRSEIIKVINAQMKYFEAIRNWCGYFIQSNEYQNANFWCFWQLLGLPSRSVIQIFFLPTGWKKKNCSCIKFDGSVGKPETRLFCFYTVATHGVHSKDSDQNGQMLRLISVFAGHTVILSCCGSNIKLRV